MLAFNFVFIKTEPPPSARCASPGTSRLHFKTAQYNNVGINVLPSFPLPTIFGNYFLHLALILWDVDSEMLLGRMPHNRQVLAVIFSPEGRWLATGSNDGSIRIWQAP